MVGKLEGELTTTVCCRLCLPSKSHERKTRMNVLRFCRRWLQNNLLIYLYGGDNLYDVVFDGDNLSEFSDAT